jgi:hypothetical protein
MLKYFYKWIDLFHKCKCKKFKMQNFKEAYVSKSLNKSINKISKNKLIKMQNNLRIIIGSPSIWISLFSKYPEMTPIKKINKAYMKNKNQSKMNSPQKQKIINRNKIVLKVTNLVNLHNFNKSSTNYNLQLEDTRKLCYIQQTLNKRILIFSNKIYLRKWMKMLRDLQNKIEWF